jgi:Kdo2-lipid IVA lauroyltransferase/acyltransferase
VKRWMLGLLQRGLLACEHRTLLRLGRVLGALWALLGIRGRLIDDNLRRAFPDKDRAWRRSVTRACLQHFATMGLELLWLPRLDPAWVRGQVDFVDPGLPARLLARGRGLIGVGGHFGNWEIMGAATAISGVPLSYIVKRIHDPALNECVDASRRAHGIETISTREAGRGVLRHFARGRLVAFLSDQDSRSQGVFVPFFGRPASTPRGAALFALRLGVPMVFVNCRRLPGGRFEIEFREVPVDPDWTLCEEHLQALTARYTAMLEDRIRRHPEQWFWMHRRWKTQPAAAGEGSA